MKTINSKQATNRHISIYTDVSNDKHVGFSGIIDVNNKKIYVNTKTGVGYDKIIARLNKLIGYLAAKYRLVGNSTEDNKQNVVLHILEGIPKYNPFKNTQLSTFLQMRVERRLINEIRNENILCRNATILNIRSFGVSCSCGLNYVATVDKKISLRLHMCDDCNEPAYEQSYVSLNNKELLLNAPAPDRNSASGESTHSDIDDVMDKSDILQQNQEPLDDSVISACDMNSWLEGEDPRLVKIVKLICFDDYSVRAAGRAVGLTGAGASMKLRELKDKKIVKEILGR